MKTIKKLDDKVILDGQEMSLSADTRGKRAKFWIESGKTERKRDYLVKFSRNEVSCENFGEILFSRLCQQVGLDCVDYHLVTVEEGQEQSQGVISENYNASINDFEVSAYTLAEAYKNFSYDNFAGLEIESKHTIDFYIEALKVVTKCSDSVLEKLRNDLLKLSLLDYLTMQSDRHWFNISFSLNSLIGDDSLKLTKIYDSGNCFLLNRGRRTISEYAKQFARSRNLDKLIFDYTVTKQPMLGLSTDLTQLETSIKDDNTAGSQKMISRCDVKSLEIFERELAEEIVRNAELGNFFALAIDKLSVEEAVKDIRESEGDCPDYVEQVATSILDCKKRRLQKLVAKALESVEEIEAE